MVTTQVASLALTDNSSGISGRVGRKSVNWSEDNIPVMESTGTSHLLGESTVKGASDLNQAKREECAGKADLELWNRVE